MDNELEDDIRKEFSMAEEWLNNNCPDNLQRDLAVNSVREAAIWAIESLKQGAD